MKFIKKSPALFILTFLLSLIPVIISHIITSRMVVTEEMEQFTFFMLELFLVPLSFIIPTALLARVLSAQKNKNLTLYPYFKLMTILSVLGVSCTILSNFIVHWGG